MECSRTASAAIPVTVMKIPHIHISFGSTYPPSKIKDFVAISARCIVVPKIVTPIILGIIPIIHVNVRGCSKSNSLESGRKRKENWVEKHIRHKK